MGGYTLPLCYSEAWETLPQMGGGSCLSRVPGWAGQKTLGSHSSGNQGQEIDPTNQPLHEAQRPSPIEDRDVAPDLFVAVSSAA